MKRFLVVLALGLGLTSGAALQAATLTPASGGNAISADTTGGSYTALSGPSYLEGSLGDVGTGNVILKAPAGFIFDTNSVVTVLLNGGSTASRNINDLANGSTIAVTVTTTSITFNVTSSSKTGSGSSTNKLTWQNVRVRPTAGTPLASGNITKAAGASMAGVTDNSTDFSTLTEVVGAAAKMFVTLPSQTFTTGTGNSGLVTTQTVGTAFSISKLTATDLHTNIVSSYSGAKTISYSGPGGSPTYTTSVSFTAGQSTTTLATTLKTAETTTITATDGTLTGVPSSSLTVIKGNQTISFGALADKTYGDASFAVNATASSGLTVTFTIVSGPATITGNTITLTGNGTVIVRAAQSGDSNWNAATNVDQSFAVAKATVTGHITASSKTYDGSASATIVTRTLTGVIGTDTVSLTNGTASFANKNVDTGKTVTATGLSLTGADAGKYNLASSTIITTADISARGLTVSATGINKVYDGNNTASVTLADDRVGGDTLSTSYTSATFGDKNVDTGKSVSVTGINVTGTDAGNYTFNTTASTTANITARSLTVTATGQNKVYDSTTDATVTLSDNRVSGDTLNTSYTTALFTDKNVSNGKTVNVTGINVTGTDAGNYTFNTTTSTTANITKATLTGSITADNKVYDGNATATIASRLLDGVIGFDTVSLTGGTANFADKNVDTGKTVTATGLGLSGTDAGNYSVNTSASTTADITARSLTVSATGVNRVYDGGTNATVTLSDNRVGGDIFTNAYETASFADKFVGNGKPVEVSGITIGGVDASNYSFNTTASTTANITAASLTVSGVTADGKVYDGNTNATLNVETAALVGVVDGDAVILETGGAAGYFASKTAGIGKTVTVSELTISDTDAVNYALIQPTTTATITPSTVTGNITADNKVYNGTTAATIASRSLDGVIDDDVVSLTGGTANFDDKTASNSKTVTATGLSLTGSDAVNYELASTSASTTADITPRALTVSATGVNRVYDTTTDATVTLSDNRVSGDILTTSYTTASFVDKDVGTGKSVSVSGIDVTGTDAGNYTFNPTASTTANISKATVTGHITADNKVYNGTTASTIASRTLTDVIGLDDVSLAGGTANFANKHIGTGKTVTATSLSLAGTDAGNYQLASTSASTTADITTRSLTVSATGVNRIYNGTIIATVTLSDDRILGDALTTSYTAAEFDDKNVGAGKSVNVSGIDLTSTDAGDYTFNTTATTTADITARALAVSATGVNRVYDGDTDATVTLSDNRVSGDILTTSYTTAAFANKSVATGKSVSVSGIDVTGTDASNYTFNTTTSTTANITTATLTGHITADNKVYDGLTTAAIASRSVDDVIGSDDVSLTGGTAAFEDKNVGTTKTVTATGLGLSGADASNYTVNTTATTTADITARALTVSATGVNRVYDGDTDATVTLSDNRALGDILTTSYTTAAFEDKNVGTGKSVSVSGIDVTGTDVVNYTFNTTASTTANITKASLTGHITADNKAYDGTTDATIATRTLTGVIGLDDVILTGGTATFINKNVGTGKTVTATGLSLANGDAINYQLASTSASTTADITGRELTVSATGVNKTYDGTTTATVTLSDDRILGDSLTPQYASAAFTSKDVGTGKTVNVSGITLTGTDSVNYTFNSTASTTANITARSLTVSATGVNRPYDGTTDATVTLSDNRVLGDVLTTSYTTAAFLNKDVATGKTVNVSGINVTGTDSVNYTFNSTASTTANITARSLTISATGVNKIYDATTNATVTLSDNRISGDVMTTAYTTAFFATKTVGTGKTISVSGITLTGTDSVNYTFNSTASTTADITARSLTISATGVNKIYDATTNATVTLSDNRFSGDVMATAYTSAFFATKTVGTGKAISVSVITLTGTDSVNYSFNTTASTTANITAKGITVTGVTASNRVYDGTTNAAISTVSAVLVGVIGGDTVTLDNTSVAGAFADKNVGTGKPVTVSGLGLAGTDGGNYTLTQPTTTANITAKNLTVSGVTASDKVYDGNTTATLNTASAALVGVVGTDIVNLNTGGATGAFADKTVGTGKAVNVSGLTISGAGVGNYTLTPPTPTANITAKGLTVTGITASNKVYDGNTNATINTASAVLVGKVSGDTVNLSTAGATGTFANKNVGTGKVVTIAGLTISGTDIGNYSLTQPTTNANITAKALTVSATGINKVYDTSASATVTLSDNRISGDTLTINYSTASFSDKNVANGKTVSVSGITVTGTDSVNYTFNTTATTTANITLATVTGSFTVSNKAYDGGTTATILTRVLSGVLSNENVTLTGGTATFDTKNFGTGKTVTGTGFTLGGNTDRNNYQLASTTLTTTANITTRSLTITATGVNKIYDATTNATVTLSDNRLSGDVMTTAYTTAFYATKTIGTGKTITVSGITLTGTDSINYTFNTTATATANITAKTLTVTGITANNKVYDGNSSALIDTAGAVLNGVVSGDTVSLNLGSVSGSFNNKNVATGKTVTINGLALANTDAGNYLLAAVTTTADITARALTVTATGVNKVYDTFTTATVTLSDNRIAFDVLSTAYTSAAFIDKTVANGKTVNVSGITVTGTDSVNYTFNTTATTTANITAVALTGSITASNKVYDGGTNATIATRTLPGVIGSDIVSYTGGTANFTDKNVGTGKTVNATGLGLSGGDAGNYTVNSTASTTANITAKTLTVTADNKNKPAGEANPPLTASYTGFASGDTTNVLTGAPSLSTTADINSTAGDYPITVTVGSLSAANYTFTFVNGTLTVGNRPVVTVTADALARTYGETNPVLTVTYTGFLNEDGTNVLTGVPDVSTTAITNSPVAGSPYPINVAIGTLSATNYDFAFVSGTLTVTPATVTGSITADNKTYDTTNTATIATRTLTGVLFDDDTTLTGGTAAFNDKTVATGKTVTATGLELSGSTAGNYVLASSNATTTADITAVTITGDIAVSNKIYDGGTTASITNRSLTGVLGTDDVTLTGGTANFDDKNVGTGKNVTATGLSLGGSDAGNYLLQDTTATTSANITPASLTITPDDKSKTAGLPNPAFTAQYTGFLGSDNAGVLTTAPTLDTLADINSPAGTYAITASGAAADNYTIDYVDGTLTVSEVPQLSATRSGTDVTLSFPTIAGQTYQLEYKDTLTDALWTPLGDPMLGDGNPIIVVTPTTGTRRFFHLAISP